MKSNRMKTYFDHKACRQATEEIIFNQYLYDLKQIALKSIDEARKMTFDKYIKQRKLEVIPSYCRLVYEHVVGTQDEIIYLERCSTGEVYKVLKSRAYQEVI